MDGFALTLVLALAAFSWVPADWKNDERATFRQVFIMASGLILLVVYTVFGAVK